MRDENDLIGKQIGSYRVIKALPSGGYGSVYQGQHLVFPDRPIVAIKVLHAHLASKQEYERFLQEARFLEKLRHPHILPIIDASMQDGLPCLIAEYASQGSLKERLERQTPKPLPVEEAITILTQVGQALHFAHQQDIVHRDLKPANILFNARGEALLADFGIAVVLEKTRRIDTIGTPAYMAPEQFDGEISKKSDQYALGCIAYELFTGHRLFDVPENAPWIAWAYKHKMEPPIPPRKVNPALPQHIEQAILQAMAKDRASRHADVSAFINALREQKTKEQWLKEGEAHSSAKRYGEALAAYEQAIRLDPTDALAYRKKGVALEYLQRYEEALAACEQAIRLDPTDVIAHHGKGVALGYLHRYEEAAAGYEQAIRLNPTYAEVYRDTGVALGYLRRYEEALAACEQAIRLDPNNADAYYNRGVVYYDLNEYQKAVADYDRAIQLDPNYALAYNGRGNTYRDLKEYQKAIADFDRAIHLDPNNADAYINRGVAYRNLKEYQKAIADYDRAIHLDPNFAVAKENREEAYRLLQGRKRKSWPW
jgi:tetratricopeptide (TPR) repeat protein